MLTRTNSLGITKIGKPNHRKDQTNDQGTNSTVPSSSVRIFDMPYRIINLWPTDGYRTICSVLDLNKVFYSPFGLDSFTVASRLMHHIKLYLLVTARTPERWHLKLCNFDTRLLSWNLWMPSLSKLIVSKMSMYCQ